MNTAAIQTEVENLAKGALILVQQNETLSTAYAELEQRFVKQAADLTAAQKQIETLQAMPKAASAPALSEDAVQHVVSFLADRQLLADLTEQGLEKLASEISQDPNKMVWLLEHTIRSNVGAPAPRNGVAVRNPGMVKKASRDLPSDDDFLDAPAHGREHLVIIR